MEKFSVKNKTDNPVSKVARRPGIPSPFVIFGKAADSLRWFSRPKPRLVQSRLAVDSCLFMALARLDVKRKGLLGRQTHLLRLLHPVGMADEYLYNIIIGHRLSSINKKRWHRRFAPPCLTI